MKVGEIWITRGLWSHEEPTLVRIAEVLPSGMVDVNYQLDPSQPGDMRILPRETLIVRVDYMPGIHVEHLPAVAPGEEADLRRGHDEPGPAASPAQWGDRGRGEGH